MPKYIFDNANADTKDQAIWRQINSARDSDFDTNSAFAELLDNSTAANSEDGSITTKNIYINFSSKSVGTGRAYKQMVDQAVFIDDGVGMDKDILATCLQWAQSTRYNDRRGIGRFGVGMTYAAIFQSKKCEVFSKTKEGSWNYVAFDMTGDPVKDPAPFITDPKKKVPPKEVLKGCETLTNGTIVILSDFDKISEDFETVVDEFKYYVARTFRHFIWGSTTRFDNILNNINFFINGEQIKAIDPLYLTTAATAHPDDPTADAWDIQTIDVPIDKNPSLQTSVEIRMSLLPKEWRKRKAQSRTPEDKQKETSRYVDKNLGISIIRKGREVSNFVPDHYWKKGGGFTSDNKGYSYAMNRWWGCEISFSPDCDKLFEVRNIKRGAKPVKDLRTEINNIITPIIIQMSEQIVDWWIECTPVKPKDDDPKPIEDIIKDDPVKDNPQNDPEEEIEERFKTKPYLVVFEDWKGDDFAEFKHPKKGLKMNLNLKLIDFGMILVIMDLKN